MNKRKLFGDLIVILLSSILLLTDDIIHASSTPKNLINVHSNSMLNDSLNTANPNQFQNEYQYRHGASKPTTSDRYKPTTISSEDLGYEHPPIDQSNAGSTDYSYSESRVATNVPDCKGRLKLNDSRGYITDGPGFYGINLQCTWLIDSGRDNATIRIRFHQFNTECNFDFLYIFDGDSIFSPLVAALSGDMKDFSTALLLNRHYTSLYEKNSNLSSINLRNETIPTALINQSLQSREFEPQSLEIEIKTGKSFIYFHSDTALRMPGFYMTYSIDACPYDCSNRGECDYSTLVCNCNQRSYGNGCQFTICPNNCTSPEHGLCDEKLSCLCKDGYYGEDCSKEINSPHWSRSHDLNTDASKRAFHKTVIVDRYMWLIGGHSQSASNANVDIYRRKLSRMASIYDLESRIWLNKTIEGVTGTDHLAELSGHSVVAKGSKIFIYGGIAMNNTVLNILSVLDTKDFSIIQINNVKSSRPTNIEEEFSAPIAVVGHTANIVDSYMYVFLGYNPLYGYINLVQRFNLADNSWSIIEKKGSYVDGCIGHTSTYDPISELVFIYGGHHLQRSNKLYSFDPHKEVWTFLQAGPSPRYYHASLVIDRQLVIFGGNSYNFTHQSDQCFQQSYLLYDLTCAKPSRDQSLDSRNNSIGLNYECGRKCWQSIDNNEPEFMKRYGHTVNRYGEELILLGGFNGVIINDLSFMKIPPCDKYLNSANCERPRIGITCRWNVIENRCEEKLKSSTNSSSEFEVESLNRAANCTKSEMKVLQILCESRETCTDCLNTNFGCVWCGFSGQCQYSKCKSSSSKTIVEQNSCYNDDYPKNSNVDMSFGPHSLRALPVTLESDPEIECKRLNNCYLCQSKSSCVWQDEECIINAPSILPAPSSNLAAQDDLGDIYASNPAVISRPTNASRALQKFDPFNRSFLAAFTSSLLNSAPNHSCDSPCYMRRSCNECTRTKCIWCSTTEQCIDASAYFTYHAMGQCMHYVAHMQKCSIASCADIQTCDKCLTNPKCGWLNDIDNRGKGRCIEGTPSGPFLGINLLTSDQNITNQLELGSFLPNWYYTSCPPCQCNGHSSCEANSSICLEPCQDNTEDLHCNRCRQGFYGDPTNGGTCRQCRCNGHATSCNRETGRCYCSTKGVTGHNCNRCDDQNHYIGDPLSPSNGTCYYNLTTDYQYTFNMSKPEDHFYSDINFINVPTRRDSDVEFSIACSRLALVSITSGTSYQDRKPIHSILGCGSHTLRFPYDRNLPTENNHSIFVHVYKFQTPFILHIAFSQHKTLKLPAFFLTFSGFFLIFFGLSGLVWKLKHGYDLYVRRQQQFIEMEQMASRPFSTVLLEMFKTSSGNSDLLQKPRSEPTPISYEPCFGSNIGVMSLFVQLPGRPNLAIGSALVSLNDDNAYDDVNRKRQEKEHVQG